MSSRPSFPGPRLCGGLSFYPCFPCSTDCCRWCCALFRVLWYCAVFSCAFCPVLPCAWFASLLGAVWSCCAALLGAVLCCALLACSLLAVGRATAHLFCCLRSFLLSCVVVWSAVFFCVVLPRVMVCHAVWSGAVPCYVVLFGCVGSGVPLLPKMLLLVLFFVLSPAALYCGAV